MPANSQLTVTFAANLGAAPVTVNLIMKNPRPQASTTAKIAAGLRDDEPNGQMTVSQGGGAGLFVDFAVDHQPSRHAAGEDNEPTGVQHRQSHPAPDRCLVGDWQLAPGLGGARAKNIHAFSGRQMVDPFLSTSIFHGALMPNLVELTMYQISQIFLLPTLALIAGLFLYAFWVLGEFALLAFYRKRGGGRRLLDDFRKQPTLSVDQLDLLAHKALENPRIASRVTPMLGLVATMIPMGPALKSLSDGNLAKVSDNLTIAFSAVILALIAASITYWVVNVRRRWLAEEMLEIETLRGRAA